MLKDFRVKIIGRDVVITHIPDVTVSCVKYEWHKHDYLLDVFVDAMYKFERPELYIERKHGTIAYDTCELCGDWSAWRTEYSFLDNKFTIQEDDHLGNYDQNLDRESQIEWIKSLGFLEVKVYGEI